MKEQKENYIKLFIFEKRKKKILFLLILSDIWPHFFWYQQWYDRSHVLYKQHIITSCSSVKNNNCSSLYRKHFPCIYVIIIILFFEKYVDIITSKENRRKENPPFCFFFSFFFSFFPFVTTYHAFFFVKRTMHLRLKKRYPHQWNSIVNLEKKGQYL